MTQTSVRQARRQRSAQIRADLLVAAERLLAEKGLDRTTINDITSEAGLGFGTFYNYFASKEEVYRELVLNGLSLLVRSIDARSKRTTDLDRRIAVIAEESAAFATDHSDLFLLLFTSDSEIHAAVREGIDGFMRSLEGWLQDGFAEGPFQPVEPQLAVRAVLGILAYGLRPLAHDRTRRSEVTASLARLIQGALFGRPR